MSTPDRLERPTPMTSEERTALHAKMRDNRGPGGLGRRSSLTDQLASNSENMGQQTVLLTRIADALDKIASKLEATP